MICALVAIAAAGGGLTLIKGDAWTAEQTWRWHDAAEEIDLTTVERVRYQVTEAGASYVIQATTTLLKSRVEDTDIPAPAHAAPWTRTYKLGIRGELLESPREEDPKKERLARLLWEPHPIDPAAKHWDSVLAGDERRGVPPLRSTSRRLERGISRGFAEAAGSPFKGEARVILDETTGFPGSVRLHAEGAPIPGGSMTASLTLDWRVVEWNLVRRPTDQSASLSGQESHAAATY